MILPVFAYGQAVLKRVADDVDLTETWLPELVDSMWETMYHANGVGLAAPQIGKSLRIFVVDTLQLKSEEREDNELGIKVAFINAHKVDELGDPWSYEEGCLSIPNVRGEVARPAEITLRYRDGDFQEQQTTFRGMNARVIQHEYDHIDGVLFIDRISPLKRRLITGKLEKIRKGQVDADYRMRFAGER